MGITSPSALLMPKSRQTKLSGLMSDFQKQSFWEVLQLKTTLVFIFADFKLFKAFTIP